MASIKIGEHTVGDPYPPFVIAEVGINHNGQIDRALAMVELAKNLGADAVKFQTFKADEFVGDPTLTYTYQSQGHSVTESMLTMFRRYELQREEWYQIKAKCNELDICFLSTPQNRSDLDLLLELGIPAIKIGSDDLTNLLLLRDYSQTGLPLILSCGMANLAEVFQALHVIGAFEGHPAVLMVCTSLYPTPIERTNLLRLRTLSAAFPMVVSGFSDHTQGHLASPLALALGAKVFEKHFTLDHDLPGPDHWFSEDPESLGQWIRSIRSAHDMMGSGVVRATPEEEKMRELARRTITAASDIHPGETLSEKNLVLMRPGRGIPARLWDVVVGAKALRPIKKGAKLGWGDFEE